ncbi:MAG: sulfite exporter TauE/SafE family protein [Rhizobiaceae bacterium]
MTPLFFDPLFYAAAIPAVIFVGLSKGGLGGLGQLGVPFLALVMSPVQGAAIMLPILIVMDLVSLWSWRGYRDVQTLKVMLPGSMLGIFIGYLAAKIVTDDLVTLIVGLLGLWFALRYIFPDKKVASLAAQHSGILGNFWGAVAGFTSFVAHAGGAPYQIYTLPLKQDPKIYTGTSTIFFAIVNAVKLIPYFALGQFDATNLSLSAVLFPLAIVSTAAGAWIVARMRAEVFYPYMLGMLLLVSVKLVYDGAAALLS